MSSVTLLGSRVLTLIKYVSTTKLGTGIHLLEKGKEKSKCSVVVVTFQKVVCRSVIVHKYFRSFDILGSEVFTLLLVNQVHVSIYQDGYFTKGISFQKNVKRNVVIV